MPVRAFFNVIPSGTRDLAGTRTGHTPSVPWKRSPGPAKEPLKLISQNSEVVLSFAGEPGKGLDVGNLSRSPVDGTAFSSPAPTPGPCGCVIQGMTRVAGEADLHLNASIEFSRGAFHIRCFKTPWDVIPSRIAATGPDRFLDRFGFRNQARSFAGHRDDNFELFQHPAKIQDCARFAHLQPLDPPGRLMAADNGPRCS